MPSEHLLKILSCGTFAIYLALQVYTLIKWRGWWRWLAVPPLVVLNVPCFIGQMEKMSLIHFPSLQWPDFFGLILLTYLLSIVIMKWLLRDSFKSNPMLMRIGAILVVMNLCLALISFIHSIWPKSYYADGQHPGPFYHELDFDYEEGQSVHYWYIACNDPKIEKARMVVLLGCDFKNAYGAGFSLDDCTPQDSFAITEYGLNIIIQREENELVVNGKRLKKGDSWKKAIWPWWCLWYAQVEEFTIRNYEKVSRAKVWEGEKDWRQRDEIPPMLDMKTDILYVRGGHYWQWHLSWRGPALLVASLLLMLYGRLRLPKKPAISES